MLPYIRPWYRKLHPETQDWRLRVIAAGGSTSKAITQAVDVFVRGIIADVGRDSIYRLNPLAGDNIQAALVPLFRGPSASGTQHGFEYDQNYGPFLSSDFSSLGLAASGVKHLRTGFSSVLLPSAYDLHTAVWATTMPATTFTSFLGWSTSSANENRTGLVTASPATSVWMWAYPPSGSNYAQKTLVPAGFIGGTIRSEGIGGIAILANAGTETVATAPAGRSLGNVAIPVFATSFNGNVSGYSAFTCGGYSIGARMTTAQLTALRSRFQALAEALGRAI